MGFHIIFGDIFKPDEILKESRTHWLTTELRKRLIKEKKNKMHIKNQCGAYSSDK